MIRELEGAWKVDVGCIVRHAVFVRVQSIRK